MSLTTLLDHLLLKPLLLIYEAVYSWAYQVGDDHGLALFAFSMVLNLVLLPIYYQMERTGREAQASRHAMEAEEKRLKTHYTGRERYYYLKTLHRQYGYNPLKVVFGSTDLFLQVLVFATVYRFLANHPPLAGASAWFLPDLSQPDGLLFGINLLPIIMTIANVCSAVLYGRDASKRRMSFALAAVFLVLLYRSPSGLVMYWTWNNLFSLGRNLVEKKLLAKLPTGARGAFTRLTGQV